MPEQPLEAAVQTWRRVCTNPMDRQVEEELRKVSASWASSALAVGSARPSSWLVSTGRSALWVSVWKPCQPLMGPSGGKQSVHCSDVTSCGALVSGNSPSFRGLQPARCARPRRASRRPGLPGQKPWPCPPPAVLRGLGLGLLLGPCRCGQQGLGEATSLRWRPGPGCSSLS